MQRCRTRVQGCSIGTAGAGTAGAGTAGGGTAGGDTAGGDTGQQTQPAAEPIGRMCCGETDHELIARLAEHHLEHAVTARDFPRTGRPPAWWHRGDQDLDDLRPLPSYRSFIGRYVVTERAPLIPPNVAILTMSLHVTDLARRFAETRREFVLASGAAFPVDENDGADENECWVALLRYCRSWRQWQVRAELIRFGHALLDPWPAPGQPPVHFEVSLDRADCRLRPDWAHGLLEDFPDLDADSALSPEIASVSAREAASERIVEQQQRLTRLADALAPIVGPAAVGGAERIGLARAAGPPPAQASLAGAWDIAARFLAGEHDDLQGLQATLLGMDASLTQWQQWAEATKASGPGRQPASPAQVKRRRIVPSTTG